MLGVKRTGVGRAGAHPCPVQLFLSVSRDRTASLHPSPSLPLPHGGETPPSPRPAWLFFTSNKTLPWIWSPRERGRGGVLVLPRYPPPAPPCPRFRAGGSTAPLTPRPAPGVGDLQRARARPGVCSLGVAPGGVELSFRFSLFAHAVSSHGLVSGLLLPQLTSAHLHAPPRAPAPALETPHATNRRRLLASVINKPCFYVSGRAGSPLSAPHPSRHAARGRWRGNEAPRHGCHGATGGLRVPRVAWHGARQR